MNNYLKETTYLNILLQAFRHAVVDYLKHLTYTCLLFKYDGSYNAKIPKPIKAKFDVWKIYLMSTMGSIYVISSYYNPLQLIIYYIACTKLWNWCMQMTPTSDYSLLFGTNTKKPSSCFSSFNSDIYWHEASLEKWGDRIQKVHTTISLLVNHFNISGISSRCMQLIQGIKQLQNAL